MMRRLPLLLWASAIVGCAPPPGDDLLDDPDAPRIDADVVQHPRGELPDVGVTPTCMDLYDPDGVLDWCLRLSPEEGGLHDDDPDFGDLDDVRLPRDVAQSATLRCGAFNLIGGPALLPRDGDELLLGYCDQDLTGGTRVVHVGPGGVATNVMVEENACLAAPHGVALGQLDAGPELYFATPDLYGAGVSEDGAPGAAELLTDDDVFGVDFLGDRVVRASVSGKLTDAHTGERVSSKSDAWGTSDSGVLATCTDGALVVRDTTTAWARELRDTDCAPLGDIGVATSGDAIAVTWRTNAATGELAVFEGGQVLRESLGDMPAVAGLPDGFVTLSTDGWLTRRAVDGAPIAEVEHPHVASAHHIEHLEVATMDDAVIVALVDRRFWADDIHYYAFDLLEVSKTTLP